MIIMDEHKDVLVRCFNICKNSTDINKLLELLLTDRTVVEKRSDGYKYYIQWWNNDEDIVDVLKDTIPEAVKYFDYDSGKEYDFGMSLLVLDGWERPFRKEFIEKMDDDGNE